jgi:hypothetical protein
LPLPSLAPGGRAAKEAKEAKAAAGWALTMPAHASVRNIAGAPLEERTVALSESPVFIISRMHKAEELARQCGLVSP